MQEVQKQIRNKLMTDGEKIKEIIQNKYPKIDIKIETKYCMDTIIIENKYKVLLNFYSPGSHLFSKRYMIEDYISKIIHIIDKYC